MENLFKKITNSRNLLIIIIILLAAFLFYGFYRKHVEEKQIQSNIATLKTMESKTVSDVETRLRQLRESYGIGRLDADNISNRRFFENTVFMGDSITEPLSFYNFLPQSNVIAVKGKNTRTALSDVKDLVNFNPQYVILAYGLNDVNVTMNADDFKSSYLKLIDEIKNTVPKAQIVMLKILHVSPSASAAQPNLSKDRVDTFNEKISEIADAGGYLLIDNTSLESDSNLYSSDGIHPQTDYYDKLLKMIKEVFINRS